MVTTQNKKAESIIAKLANTLLAMPKKTRGRETRRGGGEEMFPEQKLAFDLSAFILENIFDLHKS